MEQKAPRINGQLTAINGELFNGSLMGINGATQKSGLPVKEIRFFLSFPEAAPYQTRFW